MGIAIVGRRNEVVHNRMFMDVDGDGIEVLGVGDRNRVIGNFARTDVFGNGIQVGGPETRTLVQGNTANDNQGDGIQVEEPTAVIREKTANHNLFTGIRVINPGAIDSGGNRASGERRSQLPQHRVPLEEATLDLPDPLG